MTAAALIDYALAWSALTVIAVLALFIFAARNERRERRAQGPLAEVVPLFEERDEENVA